MRQLQEFDFDTRPSRSRYADAVSALVDDGVFAVELKRGEDFPANLALSSVQGSVSSLIRKRGKTARTRIVDKDTIVVGLQANGTSSRRRGREREAARA
jgi:hypothetical protein